MKTEEDKGRKRENTIKKTWKTKKIERKLWMGKSEDEKTRKWENYKTWENNEMRK